MLVLANCCLHNW